MLFVRACAGAKRGHGLSAVSRTCQRREEACLKGEEQDTFGRGILQVREAKGPRTGRYPVSRTSAVSPTPEPYPFAALDKF